MRFTILFWRCLSDHHSSSDSCNSRWFLRNSCCGLVFIIPSKVLNSRIIIRVPLYFVYEHSLVNSIVTGDFSFLEKCWRLLIWLNQLGLVFSLLWIPICSRPYLWQLLYVSTHDILKAIVWRACVVSWLLSVEIIFFLSYVEYILSLLFPSKLVWTTLRFSVISINENWSTWCQLIAMLGLVAVRSSIVEVKPNFPFCNMWWELIHFFVNAFFSC